MTDLYQLTMAAGYFCAARNERATFELSIRSMPANRSYFVAAGLQAAIEYLLALKFEEEDVAYVRQLPVFTNVPSDFFEYLKTFRFTGNMWAVKEGTVVFANEPLIQVEAPIIEAQIIETFILSVIHYQTLVATKASRIVHAARGRGVVDFGSRRAHGPEAGLHAARASYIGGCLGTSNVFAGKLLGIPVYGTMAHSWTLAFDSEEDAFKMFHATFPDATFLLIDTYDVRQGIRNAIRFGNKLKGVRLDSGDLHKWSTEVRKVLDQAGLHETRIMASGDLNEYRIDELLREGAPLDLFGVGTDMVTSRDQPALGAIYKMVEKRINQQVRYCAKFSEGKITYPGRKQIWRFKDKRGFYRRDVLSPLEEPQPPHAEGLLIPVIENGTQRSSSGTLHEIREHSLQQVEKLPPRYRCLSSTKAYPVRLSKEVRKQYTHLKKQYSSVLSP